MNILQIVPELKSGGVERGTVDFARYLVQEGHGSFIVSAGGPLADDLPSTVKHFKMNVHHKSLFSILSCIRQLTLILKQARIDVVHARSRVPAWIAFFACRRARIPFVTTCHGVYNTHFMSQIMSWGKLVIAISHAVSLHMKERFGVGHQRLRLIHRGVNLDEFRMAAKPKRAGLTVGIVGRITPIKGHPVLFKAMSRVLRVFPDAKLIVIGTSPRQRYQDELEMLTRRLGIHDRVEFLGTRYDVPNLVHEMDVLVAPAVGEEAFGRVIIEAGACGVPVIASRIGGIVDILEHRKDGLLVPAGDVVALSEAIVEVLKDRSFASRLARALKTKVEEQFNDRLMFSETVRVYEEVTQKQHILIIKLRALGDVILSVPSIRAIRKQYPNAKITALVERRNRVILKDCPYLDDVICMDLSKFGRWREAIRVGLICAREQFDICVDLQNSRLSHLIAYLSGAHTRVGYDNRKWSFFLNRSLRDRGEALGPVTHQFQSLKLLGLEAQDGQLELWSHREDELTAERIFQEHWLSENQPLVGLCPGASPQWPSKQWPAERFVDLCNRLSKRNIRVVILGDESQRGLAEKIEKQCRSRPVNAVGKTSVSELIALIRKCRVFISSDSAPLHVASAVQTPFVGLFGPTDPKRHVVRLARSHVIQKQIKCSPCYLRKCPIGVQCMKRISAEEVYDRVMEFV